MTDDVNVKFGADTGGTVTLLVGATVGDIILIVRIARPEVDGVSLLLQTDGVSFVCIAGGC
jgi:hypothetical protein